MDKRARRESAVPLFENGDDIEERFTTSKVEKRGGHDPTDDEDKEQQLSSAGSLAEAVVAQAGSLAEAVVEHTESVEKRAISAKGDLDVFVVNLYANLWILLFNFPLGMACYYLENEYLGGSGAYKPASTTSQAPPLVGRGFSSSSVATGDTAVVQPRQDGTVLPYSALFLYGFQHAFSSFGMFFWIIGCYIPANLSYNLLALYTIRKPGGALTVAIATKVALPLIPVVEELIDRIVTWMGEAAEIGTSVGGGGCRAELGLVVECNV